MSEHSFRSQIPSEHLRAVLNNVSTEGERLILLNKLAYSILDTSPKEALEYAEKALILGKKLQTKQQMFKSYNIIGKYYFKKEDYPNALVAFEQELEIGENLSDKQVIAEGLTNVGLVLHNLGNYDQAILKLEQALQIERSLNNQNSILGLVNNLGVLYKKKGDYEKAKGYYLQALELKDLTGDKQTETRIINNLGNIYQHKGEYEKAIQYYLQALKLNEELGNKYSIAINQNNVGIIYRKLKDYKKAIIYYSAALKLNKEISNHQGIATNLSNLGAIHEELKDYKSAITNYNKALAINRKIGNKQGIAFRLENLGSVYYCLKEYQKARSYYEKALVISEEIGSKKQIVTGLDNLGSLTVQTKDYLDAIYYYNRSIQLAKELGIELQSIETYRKLAECFSQIGDFEKAYQTHIVYSDLKDIILEQTKEIKNIQSKFDTTEKDNKIESLTLKNHELQQFTDKATHELREPIRMIGGFSDLLNRKHTEQLSEEGIEFLSIIKDATQRMDYLLNGLYNFTKLNAKQEHKFTSVDLNQTVMHVVKNLKLNIEACKATINYDALPTINAMPANIFQVFHNLIDNSLKFKSDIPPIINIKSKNIEGHHLITIEDNGIGILPKHRKQVFEVFNRLHSQSEYKGSGIGLSIVRKIICQLDGNVWIESRSKDSGIRLCLKIPKKLN